MPVAPTVENFELIDHEGETWTLDAHLTAGRPVALVTFRGAWCPYAVRDWRGLARLSGALAALDVPLFGVAADDPGTLAGYRMRLDLPFRLLSDPQLEAARRLGVAVGRRHPKARHYPARGFLQAGFVVVGAGRRVLLSWLTDAREMDGIGAALRPAPREMLTALERVTTTAAPLTAMGA